MCSNNKEITTIILIMGLFLGYNFSNEGILSFLVISIYGYLYMDFGILVG